MKTFGLIQLMAIGLLVVHYARTARTARLVDKGNWLHVVSKAHRPNFLTEIMNILRELKKMKLKRFAINFHPRLNSSSSSGSSISSKIYKNCAEVLKSGNKQSGVYNIDPDGKGAFKVYCDQKTAGGGWAVFQKRQDGSVSFYRAWNDYKKGFGDLKGEFWLGLDKIHRLTRQTKNKLRVDLQDFKGKSAYAEYDFFAVTNERNKYKLSLGSYKGTAGDSLSFHRGMAFTTKDRDNDLGSKNCAVQYKGAWWYKRYNSCHLANLNGLYHHGKHKSDSDGVNWYHWKGHSYSAKRAEMKIRPV